MARSTEVQPATLPLPGGRDGATVRLHPLLAGEMLCPPGLLERPTGRLALPRVFLGSRSDWVWIPIPAFLVEHPGAGPILIDTGLHPSVAVDPGQNFGGVWKRLLKFRMSPEQGLRQQLLARGIGHHDVGVVVMTHLHYDHASGVSEFPDPTYVVSRPNGRRPHTARRCATATSAASSTIRSTGRRVDYDAADVDSHATFGRAVDLFGDGSVRLLSTPGHTAGHQIGAAPARRPRGPAHRRCGLPGAHDQRRRAAADHPGPPPLRPLARGGPALDRSDLQRARDHRARPRALAAARARVRLIYGRTTSNVTVRARETFRAASTAVTTAR